MYPINLKGIVKGFEIYVFATVKYYFRSEIENIIALRAQECYVHELTKYLRIIYSQGIYKSE